MKPLARWVLRWLGCAALVFALPLLRVLAAPRTVSRARQGVKPRVGWVCVPIINVKYASEALKEAGYSSRTVVYAPSSIAERADFDLYRLELVPFRRWLPGGVVRTLEPYFTFVYALFSFDVLNFFYDGGILIETPLNFLELQLLRAFGKKIVVMPYGGDVHVISRMRNPLYRFGQLYHYRDSALPRMDFISQRIDYFSRYADCCVGSAAFDAVYRTDILPVNYVAIDTSLFRAPADYVYRNDGRNGPVIVVHSPNHRVIKGTEYIAAAVERLKADGLQIEFRLLEKLKNSEVRALLERADVHVELLVSGYGLSAIEGMSLGKPVISNFQGDTSALKHYSYLSECPVVLANMETIYYRLKWLVENPGVRREIGERSRRYVEKYHSYLSQQIIWGEIYRRIWHGEDVDLMMLFHPLLGRYDKLYAERVAAAPAC